MVSKLLCGGRASGRRKNHVHPTFLETHQEILHRMVDDYASSMGAALAYYTIFSLAPLLLLVIAVAGLAFGAEAARGEIVGQLRGLIGEEGASRFKASSRARARPPRASGPRSSAS